MNWAVFAEVVLIGTGLAMDAFSVAVTDGILLKKPKIMQAVKIAFFFGAFQFLMPCAGFLLGSTFARFITAFDHWVAFVLLAFIGGKMIFEAVNSSGETEEIKNPLSASTLFVMAVATSIDALAVGVSFATMGTPILEASAIIGIVTFIISFAGVYIGSRFGNLLGKRAEVTGGVVLIAIGVKILAEHTFF